MFASQPHGLLVPQLHRSARCSLHSHMACWCIIYKDLHVARLAATQDAFLTIAWLVFCTCAQWLAIRWDIVSSHYSHQQVLTATTFVCCDMFLFRYFSDKSWETKGPSTKIHTLSALTTFHSLWFSLSTFSRNWLRKLKWTIPMNQQAKLQHGQWNSSSLWWIRHTTPCLLLEHMVLRDAQ